MNVNHHSKKGLLFGASISNSKGFRIEGGETEREINRGLYEKQTGRKAKN